MTKEENNTFNIMRQCLALGLMGAVMMSHGVALAAPDERLFQALERARYASPEENAALRFTPVNMADGSRLTVISPNMWSDVAQEIMGELRRTHQALTELFGVIPPFRSSIRLMEEDEFYELTGAPGWTNAMFFRGEIIIPLAAGQPLDLENIQRSVKHEYTHAVLSALSQGAIPGWLDEGLAQWFEGDENPALRKTLKQYLRKHEPVPLALLQGGFTKLESSMVPAAYAQSLLAVQAMIKTYGLKKIALYLSRLRELEDKDAAFESAFNIPTATFEEKLHTTLKTWATGEATQKVALNTSSRKIERE